MSLSLPLDLSSSSKFSDNLQSLSLHYQKLLADYEPVVTEARAQLHAVEVLLQGTTKSLSLPSGVSAPVKVKGTPGRKPKVAVAQESAPVESVATISVASEAVKKKGPKPKATAKIKATPKAKDAATPAKGRPRRNSLLQFSAPYQGKTLTDAVGMILKDRQGKAVSIEDVVLVLYGELEIELFKIAKDRVTKNLSKGKVNGLWDRVADRLGYYILKR